MIRTIVFDAEDRERLLLAIESSLQVRNSAGFFLWTQGALQALIQHEILICVTGETWRGQLVQHFSSSRYFEQRHLEDVCFGSGALVPSLMRDWRATGQAQFLLPGPGDDALAQRLYELELRNLVACGVHGAEPHGGGFYCFGRTSLDRSERTARILGLLLPCVHATYCRVLHEESQPSNKLAGGSIVTAREMSNKLAGGSIVTAREIEILYLIKDGKNTSDIAVELSLSPFTVRNHVKNIFRKLNARSRSHAVAQAISHGILAYRTQ